MQMVDVRLQHVILKRWRTKMINGQLTTLADSGATLQFECEECVGEGYIPISNEEVVTCKECGGRGWTENLSSIPQDLLITIGAL